jgi:DNA-binding response OmpR family regulator
MVASSSQPDDGLPDFTDLIRPIDGAPERVTRALHELRTTVFRIAADCERMLEDLREHENGVWRPVVADAYVASRELASLTTHALHDFKLGDQELATLKARLAAPQRRLLDATARVLRLVPTGLTDELLHQDARAIHDRATTLLTFDRRPEAEVAVLPRRETPRALVIEDERLIRELLRRHLVLLGFDVILAENGHEGLECAEREMPDVILSDINMPEMDGMEFLRVAKAHDALREIPVVMISAQNDVESVARCIELGAEDHISKPFDPTLLNARVSASLLRKKARDKERDYLRRVAALTSAAEAAEHDAYVAGSLLAGAADDELGTLARVFDRVVTGLRSREVRLQRRLEQLRDEVGSDTGESTQASATGDSPFASGEILAGRYEILGKLGDGGMGMVYHARDKELGDEVAVKVVRKDLIAEDPTIVERLKSEIRLARRVSHRNVVRLHDLGEWHGTYFISMEFVRGVNVATLLDRRGRLTIESTLAIGSQLAEALAVAHEQQIIHRDIKPANLLVDETGTLKVMDFGIARSIERDAKKLTASGFIVGTPQYMAPEQLCGRAVDGRTDLFALGVVLYECLTGTLPFSGDTPVALNERIESCAFISLRDRRPEVPEQLEALVHQQLQPRPASRAESARELAERLHDLEHAPIASAQ